LIWCLGSLLPSYAREALEEPLQAMCTAVIGNIRTHGCSGEKHFKMNYIQRTDPAEHALAQLINHEDAAFPAECAPLLYPLLVVVLESKGFTQPQVEMFLSQRASRLHYCVSEQLPNWIALPADRLSMLMRLRRAGCNPNLTHRGIPFQLGDLRRFFYFHAEVALEWLMNDLILLDFDLTSPTSSGEGATVRAHDATLAAWAAVKKNARCSILRLFDTIVQKTVDWQQQQRAYSSIGGSPAASTVATAAPFAPRLQLPMSAATQISTEPTPMMIDDANAINDAAAFGVAHSLMSDVDVPSSSAPSAGTLHATDAASESALIDIDSECAAARDVTMLHSARAASSSTSALLVSFGAAASASTSGASPSSASSSAVADLQVSGGAALRAAFSDADTELKMPIDIHAWLRGQLDALPSTLLSHRLYRMLEKWKIGDSLDQLHHILLTPELLEYIDIEEGFRVRDMTMRDEKKNHLPALLELLMRLPLEALLSLEPYADTLVGLIQAMPTDIVDQYVPYALFVKHMSCAPCVEALCALLEHHRAGGLHPFYRRLQYALIDRFKAAKIYGHHQWRLILKHLQGALALNADLWSDEQLEAEVALLTQHGFDAGRRGKTLLWHLVDAGNAPKSRWWIDRFGRHSDWLWLPMVREAPSEEGGLPTFRFHINGEWSVPENIEKYTMEPSLEASIRISQGDSVLKQRIVCLDMVRDAIDEWRREVCLRYAARSRRTSYPTLQTSSCTCSRHRVQQKLQLRLTRTRIVAVRGRRKRRRLTSTMMRRPTPTLTHRSNTPGCALYKHQYCCTHQLHYLMMLMSSLRCVTSFTAPLHPLVASGDDLLAMRCTHPRIIAPYSSQSYMALQQHQQYYVSALASIM
jgi:hypothetical protein